MTPPRRADKLNPPISLSRASAQPFFHRGTGPPLDFIRYQNYYEETVSGNVEVGPAPAASRYAGAPWLLTQRDRGRGVHFRRPPHDWQGASCPRPAAADGDSRGPRACREFVRASTAQDWLRQGAAGADRTGSHAGRAGPSPERVALPRSEPSVVSRQGRGTGRPLDNRFASDPRPRPRGRVLNAVHSPKGASLRSRRAPLAWAFHIGHPPQEMARCHSTQDSARRTQCSAGFDMDLP